MPLEDVLALYSSLQNLSMVCYPQKLDYVDEVFLLASDIVGKRGYVFFFLFLFFINININ